MGSACGENGVGGPYAARVGDTEISEREFLRELRQFRDNERASEAFALGGGTGRVSAEISASWLNVLIQDALVAIEFDRRDLDLTEGELRQAEQLAVQQFGGEQVWGDFDQWFRDRVTTRLARIVKLQGEVGGDVSEEALRAEFERTKDDLEPRVCVSHILVDELETAEQLRAEIEAGASFEDLAKEHSTDPGSGAQGGDLGCHTRGAFVGPFDEAAWSLPPGQLSEPIQTQFGWHLVLVQSRGAPSFEDVQQEIAGRLQAASQQDFAEAMNELLAGLEIKVNPKYGSFDPEARTGGFVQPPAIPQVSEGPPPKDGTEAEPDSEPFPIPGG